MVQRGILSREQFVNNGGHRSTFRCCGPQLAKRPITQCWICWRTPHDVCKNQWSSTRGQTTVEAAVREGWNVLRAVMRTWGVTPREQLTDWMVRQGLPRVSDGNHIAGRARKGEAATVDARVALLEAAYVMVTIQAGEPSNRVPVPKAEPRRPIAPSTSPESWEQLGHNDLSEAFTTWVPMLRSCPRFFEGTSALQFGVALRERSRSWRIQLRGHVTAALSDVMRRPNALTISREVLWMAATEHRITVSGNKLTRTSTVPEAPQPRVG